MFTLTVFQILLFEGRSVLGATQRIPGNQKVKKQFFNKNQFLECRGYPRFDFKP